MKTLFSLIFVLFVALSTYSQEVRLSYDLVMDSHSKDNGPAEVDNVSEECGYFSLNDSTITLHADRNKLPIVYHIEMKVLDLDCKCYYRFAKDNYLVVVNTARGFVLVTKLNLELMYIRTYYLKTD